MLGEHSQDKFIDCDERGNAVMTLRTVKHYCEKESLFATPELNDKLYLQYKGFLRIMPQTLQLYQNLTALWLNNNGITKIEGLTECTKLTSLYLNNNFIERIQGLQSLKDLSILNLAHNKIETVQGLQQLPGLSNVNLSKNFIINQKGLEGLSECPSITTLDLSQNQLENSEEVFAELIKNANVVCFYLKSTPIARGLKNYRKRFIASMKKLKFLDDRPVHEQDHRLAEAWQFGGTALEQSEKLKIIDQASKKLEEQTMVQNQKPKPQEKVEISQVQAELEEPQSKHDENIMIEQYLKNESKLREEEIIKLEKEHPQVLQSEEEMNQQIEEISKKVRRILGKSTDPLDIEDQNEALDRRIKQKWNKKYEKLLGRLLQKYFFDFSQAQPSFNMIINDINRKIMSPSVRFQINELRRIWTVIEEEKRKQQKQIN